MQLIDISSFEKSQTQWAELVVARERDFDNIIPKNSNSSIYRMIRGKRCQNVNSLFQEWAAALEFPYYFGHNWSAFDECINDLSWLQGKRYLFCISNIHYVLKDDISNLKIFFELLKTTAKTWREPVPEGTDFRWTKKPVPFHVLLHCEEASLSKCLNLFSTLNLEFTPKYLPKLDSIL